MEPPTILVRYACCCDRWDLGGSLFSEPPECPGEGDIEVDLEEWEAGTVSHDCDACGTTLYQQDDHFHEVPDDAVTAA